MRRKRNYGFAILHGEKVANPADDVGPASIATFVPKDRLLSPTEIRIVLKLIEKVAKLPTTRLGMRLYLQTMVRKIELQDATGGRFRDHCVYDPEAAMALVTTIIASLHAPA